MAGGKFESIDGPRSIRAIDDVRDARKIVQRFAVQAGKGHFGEDDLDVPRMLFGTGAVEYKLSEVGLLSDPDLALGEISERAKESLLYVMEDFLSEELLEAMAAPIAARFARERDNADRLKAERDSAERPSANRAFAERYAPGGRKPESLKQILDREASLARLAAVHLAQRAFYVGLSRALLKLATDQAKRVEGRMCSHAAFRFSGDQEAVADKAIERHRRRLDAPGV